VLLSGFIVAYVVFPADKDIRLTSSGNQQFCPTLLDVISKIDVPDLFLLTNLVKQIIVAEKSLRPEN